MFAEQCADQSPDAPHDSSPHADEVAVRCRARSSRSRVFSSTWGQISGAVIIGVASFALSYIILVHRGYFAGDFTWPYGGAHRLLAGLNPYQDPHLGPSHPYPFQNQNPYPMPGLILAIPFSLFNPYLAGALFYGMGSGLLAYGLLHTREYHRLPLFISPSFIVGAMVAQWPPLIMAGAFVPWLQVLAVCKPNLGIPILLLWFRRKPFAVAAAFVLATLLLMPLWPMLWLLATRGQDHHSPILALPGLVLLLALLRWRTREGQFLLWMAFAPQLLFFYDQLMLWLIPRTWRHSLFMLAANWTGFVAWVLTLDAFNPAATMGQTVGAAIPFVMVFFYLPALAIVLTLPPKSGQPDWMALVWRPQLSRAGKGNGGSAPSGLSRHDQF